MTIATTTGQGENAYHGVEVALLGGACLKVCLSDGSGSDGAGKCLPVTGFGGDGVAGHSGRFVWYESIIRGGEGSWETPCATMPAGCGDTPADTQTVPDCWGQYGRGTRRTCRRSPYAPPHQGSGTTGSATRSGCKGSGSGLRFASVGLVGMNQL